MGLMLLALTEVTLEGEAFDERMHSRNLSFSLDGHCWLCLKMTGTHIIVVLGSSTGVLE